MYSTQGPPRQSDNRRLVIFSFAGREEYMSLQTKYVDDMLSRIPQAEFHIWNFSRKQSDNEYLQNLAACSGRIRIFNEFYEGENKQTICQKKIGFICSCVRCRVGKWSEPYKFYASNAEYSNSIFMKIDDDIVFVESKKINDFVALITQNPGKIVTADVINNGRCASADPLQRKTLLAANIAPKETPARWFMLCVSREFFFLSHKYFFENFYYVMSQEISLLELQDGRLSINFIAFDASMMKQIAALLGDSPGMHDEAVITANFPIHLCKGFTACHLHFSDQRATISRDEEMEICNQYFRLMKKYLSDTNEYPMVNSALT